jgi:hypothetical protein
MERDYDLFEIMPDGTPLWREAVKGHENAIKRLQDLSTQTENEIRLMHLPTNALIAQKNVREG